MFDEYLLHQVPHLKFPIGELPKSSYVFGLANTGSRLDSGNLNYHQSVAERHPNLLIKFLHLKDIYGVHPVNISGVNGGK